jgi:hypothetical protein
MDDLEAYFDTLPSNSATKRKLFGITEDLDTFLLSVVVDSVRHNTHARAGKKLPEDARMSPRFLTDSKTKTVNKRLAAAEKEERALAAEKKGIAPATFAGPPTTIAESLSKIHDIEDDKLT